MSSKKELTVLWDQLLVGHYKRCEFNKRWYINIKGGLKQQDLLYYISGEMLVAIILESCFTSSYLFIIYRYYMKAEHQSYLHFYLNEFPYGRTQNAIRKFLRDILNPAEIPVYMGSGYKMVDTFIEAVLRG